MPANTIIFEGQYMADQMRRIDKAKQLTEEAMEIIKKANQHRNWKCRETTEINNSLNTISNKINRIHSGLMRTGIALGRGLVSFTELEQRSEIQANSLTESLKEDYGFEATNPNKNINTTLPVLLIPALPAGKITVAVLQEWFRQLQEMLRRYWEHRTGGYILPPRPHIPPMPPFTPDPAPMPGFVPFPPGPPVPPNPAPRPRPGYVPPYGPAPQPRPAPVPGPRPAPRPSYNPTPNPAPSSGSSSTSTPSSNSNNSNYTPSSIPQGDIEAAKQAIWDFLREKIGNDYGVAALMGNLNAESGFSSNNLQNSYEGSIGLNDDSYTAAVDNGSYNNFVNDSAGYGIAQWTYSSRKQALLDFAKEKGTSVGDLITQLEFLWKELTEGYSNVVNALKNATSIREASDVVLKQFERPYDQSDSACAGRASLGENIYSEMHLA